MKLNLNDRHPSVQSIARFFAYDHLPEGNLRETSRECCALAEQMISTVPDSPELAAGLRKLLEAKDCFVRASLSDA